MVGGSQDVFDAVKPVFEKLGKNITLVGANGDGQTTKVANQIIVALNIEAVAEALVFAAKMGADPARVRQALMGGFASSRILEVHGERMIKRTFAPGFRIELHQKDLNLALQSAKSVGVSLPNTATAQELFNACAAHGGKAWDHSAHGSRAGIDGQFRSRAEVEPPLPLLRERAGVRVLTVSRNASRRPSSGASRHLLPQGREKGRQWSQP